MVAQTIVGCHGILTWLFGQSSPRCERRGLTFTVTMQSVAAQMQTVSSLAPGAIPQANIKNPPQSNHDEFEALAMPFARIMYATAYRMIGNSASAEELVQDTYVCAWQKFSHFNRGTNFKAWIFQILVNLIRNKRRAVRNEPINIEFSPEQERAAIDPEKPALAALPGNWKFDYAEWVDDEFKRALDRLDDDHRTIFMLVTMAELPYQECADILSLPIGTVMSRLYRARKQLQSDLQDYARSRGILRGKKEAE